MRRTQGLDGKTLSTFLSSSYSVQSLTENYSSREGTRRKPGDELNNIRLNEAQLEEISTENRL